MKTFELMDGTEVLVTDIVSIGPIKQFGSLAAAIPAYGTARYEISLKNGMGLSSSDSWREGFFSGDPKDPQEKEKILMKLRSERKQIMDLWKSLVY